MGKVVYICTDGAAHETTQIYGKFNKQECPDGFAIDTGSGDAGLAIFRRGGAYTITAGEDTILTAAGYVTT